MNIFLKFSELVHYTIFYAHHNIFLFIGILPTIFCKI